MTRLSPTLFMVFAVAAALIGITPWAAHASAWPPSQPQDLYFTVLREGSPMGFHRVRFSTRDDSLVVNTEIELKVKIAFVTLFKYSHQSEEVWTDGGLVSLVSETNDNGKKKSLVVSRQEGQVIVDGADYSGPVPKEIIPSSYWNYALVSRTRMLNTQTGEPMPVVITPMGQDQVMRLGELASATRYNVKGTAELDLWYDQTQNWVGSQFTVRGTTLTYVLTGRDDNTDQVTRVDR